MKKMQASPIYIPTVSNDTDWDFCFHLSPQTPIPAQQQTDEVYPTYGSEESEEDTAVQEEEAITDYMSLPKEKLVQSQKKITQLIKEKMTIQANKELIRCVILSRIVFGEEHWRCAQALTNLAYGYLVLRGLPAQAKKHAESAKNILLTWKGNASSDKEQNEILEALVMLYYTLGVVWLLQNHGREAYFNLQKADKHMKELNGLTKRGICGLYVSEKDLTIALGRASLAVHRLNLALAYFEKAYSISVSSFTEVSPQTAEASALLAKAYAMSGKPQHRDAVETYFIKSISAYQATLGSEDYETLTTIEEFCKWLVENGDKQDAYKLLKASLKSQIISYGDCSKKVAETFYNLGRICFANGELRKAIQLLRKCLMIQIFIYGSEHNKSKETKGLLTQLQRESNNPSKWKKEAIQGKKNCICKGTEA
ncbi:tetratricopeptide repeat protein 23-like isoform X3 [Sciurus carolinensis]|uniref:tetratricopeptide repeat protein 23-like isoform X3 n=1 Tax=Sciurus carolinensis TaxID=30640 RepID=UPI001FB1AFD7|nr:tetratricopeptide repeat protein 23-like isoform X3 [Sciurus carolinensis]